MSRSVLAVVCLLTLVACGRESGPPAAGAPAVKLYAMSCGEIGISDLSGFADDGSMDGMERRFVDPCYLIRHPKGDLMWDTGLPDAIHDGPVDSGIFHLEVPVKVTDQLAELGLAPGDIEYFSVSHSHFDHVGNAALLENATWIVDADERAHVFRDEARADPNFGIVAPLEAFETTLIEGDNDHDVFGDGSVVIVQTPGHTPGHAALLVRFAKSEPLILTGDLWHLAESRERRLVPRFNTDREQTLRSMDKVEKLAADTGAQIIRQHVPEDFAALPKFPEAVE